MSNLQITEELVQALINSQFPQWSNLKIQAVQNGGNDNRTFRLGNSMSIRLPSAKAYAAQVEKENLWLPKLAPNISTPITSPLALGKAEFDYPFNWSVNKWIEGEPLTITDPQKDLIAKGLASFLKELQAIDSTDGPKGGKHNFYRGGKLSVYSNEVEESIKKLGNKIDISVCKHIWSTAISSHWKDRSVWVHGDIAMGNILHQDYLLAGVIDFGILGVGDPACDLVMAWTYFDDISRSIFMEEMDMDTDTWGRARGWALWKALITFDNEHSKEVVSILQKEYHT